MILTAECCVEKGVKMKFKNDKERTEFLVDYRNTDNGWYLWKEDKDLQRRWWRHDFEGCCMVVEEQLRTHTWPKLMTEWDVVHWFIIEDTGIPFADGTGSRSLALTKLKELEKAEKEKV